jgi:hypothetical protein
MQRYMPKSKTNFDFLLSTTVLQISSINPITAVFLSAAYAIKLSTTTIMQSIIFLVKIARLGMFVLYAD